MWQWSKSMTMDGTYMDIDTATSMTYTPVEADEGYYLRATASYTDGEGSGKMRQRHDNEHPVTVTADPLLVKYDVRHQRHDRQEDVIAAIRATSLTRKASLGADVIKVIRLYFGSANS